MGNFSEKHVLLRVSIILGCIGFVCYLKFPALQCPDSSIPLGLCASSSGKAHQAFAIISLVLFYSFLTILFLYVFIEEASNHNLLAFVCFVLAFLVAAFILLAAFVEPSLIHQSATSWAALGATCSCLDGILLLVYCFRGTSGA